MKHYITICYDYLNDGCNINMGDTVKMCYDMDSDVDTSLFEDVKVNYFFPNVLRGTLKVKVLEYFHIPNSKTIMIAVDMPKEIKEMMKKEKADWDDLFLDLTINGEEVDWFIGHSFLDLDLVLPYLKQN